MLGKRKKSKSLVSERERPLCPECSMRMLPAKPVGQFECLRCGYVGRIEGHQEAARVA